MTVFSTALWRIAKAMDFVNDLMEVEDEVFQKYRRDILKALQGKHSVFTWSAPSYCLHPRKHGIC